MKFIKMLWSPFKSQPTAPPHHAYIREATAEPRKADTNPVSQCDNMGLPQI